MGFETEEGTETPTENGPDLTDAERLVDEAAAEDGAADPGQSGPIEGEVQTDLDRITKARDAARAGMRILEKVFNALSPKPFEYGEEVYRAAEQDLAPVILKHEIEDSGPVKAAPEINAGVFLFGVVSGSVAQVKRDRAEAKEEAEKTAPNEEGKIPVTKARPNTGGRFTTQ